MSTSLHFFVVVLCHEKNLKDFEKHIVIHLTCDVFSSMFPIRDEDDRRWHGEKAGES